MGQFSAEKPVPPGSALSGNQHTIVTGICIPSLGLIQARVSGFKKRIAEKMSSASVIGPIDVTFDPTENYSRWRSAVDANPGAIAYIGFCEDDLPNLVRIKQSDPKATYEIASIGVDPDGLKGIADGVALAAIGQKPFMQGYVAMRAMLMKLAAHRGHKGVGLAIVMGMLSTLLSGASYGTALGNMEDGAKPGRDGQIFMAIEVAAFQPLDGVRRRVDAVSRQIRTSRREAGADQLYPPGRLEAEFELERLRTGIPLNDETIMNIEKAAQRLKVPSFDT